MRHRRADITTKQRMDFRVASSRGNVVQLAIGELTGNNKIAIAANAGAADALVIGSVLWSSTTMDAAGSRWESAHRTCLLGGTFTRQHPQQWPDRSGPRSRFEISVTRRLDHLPGEIGRNSSASDLRHRAGSGTRHCLHNRTRSLGICLSLKPRGTIAALNPRAVIIRERSG